MFHRFNNSARRVLFRAHDHAEAEASRQIEPRHILIALDELHPELLTSILARTHTDEVRRELRQTEDMPAAGKAEKHRFSSRSRYVLVSATEEAEVCWRQFEQPRRSCRAVLPEDVAYWASRIGQPIRMTKPPGWFGRWVLRRSWEVDERHLLLGLLRSADCSPLAKVVPHGVTVAAARQRLCAPAGQ